MALVGTGQNSNLQVPESTDPMREFEEATKSNRPNLALYHLLQILREQSEEIAELREAVNASTKKTSTKKSTSSKSDAKDE